jgi:hypothetical protein
MATQRGTLALLVLLSAPVLGASASPVSAAACAHPRDAAGMRAIHPVYRTCLVSRHAARRSKTAKAAAKSGNVRAQ